MPFDTHSNFAVSAVATAPSPATTGTAVTVTAGEGARFPAVPFNASVVPVGVLATPANSEIVRVTARSGDVLTLGRAQEGSTARAIQVGDLIAATITAKTITDIESGVNFPLITTPGNLSFTGAVGAVGMNTADGADNAILQLRAGGAGGSLRGATINMFGNEASDPGSLSFYTGSPGKMNFIVDNIQRGTIFPSGGFSWGSTVDPGAGNLSVNGHFIASAQPSTVRASTTDGADTSYLAMCGGGAEGNNRGAFVVAYGNEAAGSPGALNMIAGDVPGAAIAFYTQPSYSIRMRIAPTGEVQINTTGMANGQLNVVTDLAGHNAIALQNTNPSNNGYLVGFFNSASGFMASIQQTGVNTVAYNTGSDARLKRDRGRHTDPEVLRRTVIHNFDWKADGLPGRGVFAQEAQSVAPFAVSVGTDERDESGNLKQPWGVDYSKYVPDLITGWQTHDQELERLRADVATLRAAAAQRAQSDLSSAINRLVMAVRAFVRAWVPSWV